MRDIELAKGSAPSDKYLNCDAILINEQVFTKTANIWGG
jgi:hypothetical protein